MRATMIGRALALLALVIPATALPAPAAHAVSDATVYVDLSVSPSKLVYRAGTGQANNVTFTRRGDELLVSDVVPLTVGAGCRHDGAATRAACEWAFSTDFALGDQNDRLDAASFGSGLAVTVDGGAGNDVVVGSDGPDKLEGNIGADNLYGRGGNDVLHHCYANRQGANDCLAPLEISSDMLVGEGGADKLTGSAYDWLWGSAGDDVLDGGDFQDGGAGKDTHTVASGADVYGGPGDDLITAPARINGSVHFEGGDGDDWLEGAKGVDELLGGPGNDRLYGGDNAGDRGDVLWGGPGNDKLSGSDGDDTLHGEDGDDILWGNGGSSNVLYGGNGDDRLEGDWGGAWIPFHLLDGGPHRVGDYCSPRGRHVNCNP